MYVEGCVDTSMYTVSDVFNTHTHKHAKHCVYASNKRMDGWMDVLLIRIHIMPNTLSSLYVKGSSNHLYADVRPSSLITSLIDFANGGIVFHNCNWTWVGSLNYDYAKVLILFINKIYLYCL